MDSLPYHETFATVSSPWIKILPASENGRQVDRNIPDQQDGLVHRLITVCNEFEWLPCARNPLERGAIRRRRPRIIRNYRLPLRRPTPLPDPPRHPFSQRSCCLGPRPATPRSALSNRARYSDRARFDLRNNRGNCENRMGSGARGSAASTIFSPASLIIPNVVQSLSRMEACLKWKSAWNRSAPRMEVCTEWQARI